jgi:hypothetical protein
MDLLVEVKEGESHRGVDSEKVAKIAGDPRL